jgi:hypothetical protein
MQSANLEMRAVNMMIWRVCRCQRHNDKQSTILQSLRVLSDVKDSGSSLCRCDRDDSRKCFRELADAQKIVAWHARQAGCAPLPELPKVGCVETCARSIGTLAARSQG